MVSEPSIDYGTLQQVALRGVVRAVLQRIVKAGLPGEHHFYISFVTKAPGVVLSRRLKEKYPTEMTIVLQYRFWDLTVSDDRFEVKLTFDDIPERLVVPFAAIKVFIDPSVRYGLQFDAEVSERDAALAEPHFLMADAMYDDASTAAVPRPKKPRTPRKARTANKGTPGGVPALVLVEPSQSLSPNQEPATLAEESSTKDGDEAAPEKQLEGGAKVLSLDQFRKK